MAIPPPPSNGLANSRQATPMYLPPLQPSLRPPISQQPIQSPITTVPQRFPQGTVIPTNNLPSQYAFMPSQGLVLPPNSTMGKKPAYPVSTYALNAPIQAPVPATLNPVNPGQQEVTAVITSPGKELPLTRLEDLKQSLLKPLPIVGAVLNGAMVGYATHWLGYSKRAVAVGSVIPAALIAILTSAKSLLNFNWERKAPPSSKGESIQNQFVKPSFLASTGLWMAGGLVAGSKVGLPVWINIALNTLFTGLPMLLGPLFKGLKEFKKSE